MARRKTNAVTTWFASVTGNRSLNGRGTVLELRLLLTLRHNNEYFVMRPHHYMDFPRTVSRRTPRTSISYSMPTIGGRE
jgi:hypothetical protein